MMTSRIVGKLCSALILCILFSAFAQHEFTQRARMTREEYLAKQGARYDRQISRPYPYVLTFIAGGFMVVGFLGVYEVIGFGVALATRKMDGSSPTAR